MRDTGNLSSLSDVTAILGEWSRSIPDEHAHRWIVTPIRSGMVRAQPWCLVRVDTTAADALVILPVANSANSGKQVAVHVIAGANQAIVRDDTNTAFGKRSSPISLDYSGLFVSVGTHWELLAGGA